MESCFASSPSISRLDVDRIAFRTAPPLPPSHKAQITQTSETVPMEESISDKSPNEAEDRPIRLAVLEEAAVIVTGARESTYGGPEQSFRTIADLWSVYLDRPIASHDVAAMLALVKLARLKHSNGRHGDSWVDLAGYAACGAECVGKKE